MAAPKTITLSEPIQAHGEEVTELTFRGPTLGDLEEYELTTAGLSKGSTIIGLTSKLTGLPPSSIRKIEGRDLAKIQEVVTGFFDESLQTGET